MSQAQKASTSNAKKTKPQEEPIEVDEPTNQEESSPNTTQKNSKTALLTINPFLGPKSPAIYERSNSASKLATSSPKSGGRPSSARGTKTSQFKSNPSSPSIKVKKTDSDQTDSPNKSKPLSQFGQQFFEENKKVSEQMRKQGTEFFEIKQQSKNLEQDLKSLENRVERLKWEEQNSLKRLDNTQKECQEVVDNKLRHQNDLLEKEYRNQKLMADLANQRKEQMEDKMKLNEGILKSMISTMEKKNNQKKEVKQVLADENERYARETAEKNKIRDKIIDEIQDLRRRIVEGKKEKEEAAKHFALVTHHQDKIEAEQKKQDEINQRLEELIRQEEALLDKIRATNTLHAQEFQKMEKVFAMRVSTDKPLELP